MGTSDFQKLLTALFIRKQNNPQQLNEEFWRKRDEAMQEIEERFKKLLRK